MLKYASQLNIAKITKLSYFVGSRLFQVIDVDITGMQNPMPSLTLILTFDF